MYNLDIVTVIICVTVLIIASITDIKRREVPDWLNHGLIYFGFGYNIIKTIIAESFSPIISSITGFILFFVVGYMMYIFGQWGGGDTKMLMGLGSLVGITIIGDKKNLFLLTFLLNILFIGAIYGFLWSFGLAIKKRKTFIKNLKEFLLQENIIKLRITILTFSFVGIILVFFIPSQIRIGLFALIALIFLIFYAWIFIKVTDKSCMIKEIDIEKLTEGDWVLDDVVLDKQIFLKTKDSILGEKNLNKIYEFYNTHNPVIKVTKKMFFFKRDGLKRLSELREGEIIREDFKKKNISIRKNKIISENDIIMIKQYLRMNSFIDVNVKRRFLFFYYVQKIPVTNLKLSDYLLDNIEIANIVCGPRDLGISKDQINYLIELKKKAKIKKILIKEGMPFVPTFLLGFIFNLFYGQWFMLFFR